MGQSQGQHVRAGANTGGVKGNMPQDDEGVLEPGTIKGAGPAMPADVEDSSGRDDPNLKPHVTTQMHVTKNDVAP